MQCPYCQSEETKVVDSRKDEAGTVQRRRQCKGCGARFSTVERINVDYLAVKKQDGRIERFQREKIVRAIGSAASVFKIPAGDVNAFIDRILDQLQPESPGVPIQSRMIGELVLKHLQDSTAVTDVARIRFAMVFLGKVGRPGGFRNSADLMAWLAEHYPTLKDLDVSLGPAIVLKRVTESEPFDADKLQRSIMVAAKGRGTSSHVRALASRTTDRVIMNLGSQPIVTSKQIAAATLNFLRAEDDIAYLRYAAVTKPFRSAQDFWIETLALMAGTEPR